MTRDLRTSVGMADRRQPPRSAPAMIGAFRTTNEMIAIDELADTGTPTVATPVP
jgi:hypothetical protein